MTPDEKFDQWQIARHVIWRYELDKMETASLNQAMKTIRAATDDLFQAPTRKLTRWQSLRNKEVLQELRNMTTGIREQITQEISSSASIAGAESTQFHSDTLSIRGRSPNVNNVALSPAQFRSFFQDTPLGGKTLGKWVDSSFDNNVIQQIQQDLNSEVLKGKSYKAMTNRIQHHMSNFSRTGAVLIARSYTQSANVLAQQAVMEANSDIVTGWKWSSVLESGNIATGNGTCIYCACLDGNVYKHGEGPHIPLHPNCRCFPVSQTVSYRSLGVEVDELDEVARPWTIREDIPIGEGGRNILQYGTHKGNYATWFNNQGEAFQKRVVGKGRYDLIKQGKVKFKDLVDPNTGRLYRINELPGGVGPGDKGLKIIPPTGGKPKPIKPVPPKDNPQGNKWGDPIISSNQTGYGREKDVKYWEYDIEGGGGLQGRTMTSNRKIRVERKLQDRLATDPDWNYMKEKGGSLLGYSDYSPEGTVISQWAGSSQSPTSIFFQRAAQKEFNMRDASMTHFLKESSDILEDRLRTLKAAGVDTDRLEMGARKFMRAMYEQTQADFKAQGIKEITVFRGMNIEQSTLTSIQASLKGKTAVPNTGRANMKFQPLSSWSQDVSVARDFTGSKNGVIVSAKVPVEDVIGSALSGYGCLSETEYVIMGGSFNVLGIWGNMQNYRGMGIAKDLEMFLKWERSRTGQ